MPPVSRFVVVSALLGSATTLVPCFAQTKAAPQSPNFVSPLQFGNSAPPTATQMGKALVGPAPGAAAFAKGVKAYQKRDWRSAEKWFRQTVKEDAKFSEGWANLGLTLEFLGQPTEAVGAFQKAVATTRVKKATGPFYEELTRLYARQHKWPETGEAARKGIASGGARDSDTLLAFQGMALLNQRRFAEALPILRKNKRLPGEAASVPDTRLIFALAQTGKTAEARELAQKLATRFPKEVGPQMMVADLAQQQGDLNTAAAAWRKAYAIAPNDPRAAMNAAIAATRQNDRPGAEKILRALLAKKPDDARAHFQLGLLYYGDPAKRKEQFPFAEREFRTAAVNDPKTPQYITYLALSVLQQGPARYNDAEKLLQSALQLDPDGPLVRMNLGFLAEQKKNGDEAIEQYRVVVASHRDETFALQARLRIADLQYQMGRKDEAYREYDAIAISHEDEVGTTALAQEASLLLTDGKLEPARNAYARFVTRAPKNPQAYIGLGQSLERLSKPTEAQKAYEMALSVDPKNDNAALLLGTLFKNAKQPTAAIALYEKLLAAAGPKEEHNRVRMQLASDYQELNRIDDALAQYAQITLQKGDPYQINLLLMRPQVMMAHDRYPQAITELTRLAKENPQADAIPLTLAEAQEKASQPAAAERTLTNLINSKQRLPKGNREAQIARIRLAELYERQKKWDDAAILFEESLRLDPLDTRALPGLSRVRLQQKQPEAVGTFLETLAIREDAAEPSEGSVAAVERYYKQNAAPEKYVAFTKRLAEKFPNHRPSLKRRIDALLPELNRADAAPLRTETETLARHLIELDPNDGLARVQLGGVLEAEGRKADAIAAYTEAVRLRRDNLDAITALRRLGAPIPEPPPAAAPAPRPGKKP